MKKLLLVIAALAAIGACERVVELSPDAASATTPSDAGTDGVLPDGGEAPPDGSVGDAALDGL